MSRALACAAVALALLPAAAGAEPSWASHLLPDAASCAPEGVACAAARAAATMAPAAGDVPAPCYVAATLADRLDLASYPNSAGPRVGAGGAVPADLYATTVLPLCAGVAFSDEGWDVAMTPVAVGDLDGDGGAEALVVVSDRARDGSYATLDLLAVSLAPGPRVAARVVCGEGGDPAPACGP